MLAMQGDWVEAENTVLNPGERVDNLPASTKKTPLKMWVRGFLQEVSADVGDHVKVKTLTGRIVDGTLVQLNPSHRYDYGETVPELLVVGEELKSKLQEVLARGVQG